MPGCSAVGSARLLGSRGRWFKSSHPDHEHLSKKNSNFLFPKMQSGLFKFCKAKFKAPFLYQGLAQLVARTPGGREVASSSLVSLTKHISGCGAVGSARRSGRRGRRFKSDHPDQTHFRI